MIIKHMDMDLSNVRLDKSKKSMWNKLKGYILDIM